MGLADDCQQFFDTKDLYAVLGVGRGASIAEIKKSYRRLSLKHHPDRQASDSRSKEEMTRVFQTLSKVHYILSDADKRAFYDSTGIIDQEDGLDGEADWDDYFRALFPKVTKKDLDNFMQNYIGSEEELEDLKKYYLKCEGDMDLMQEYLIAFDETRTRTLIEQLIAKGEIDAFEKFVNEPPQKRKQREKKAEKEAKAAKKVKLSDEDDLVTAIQQRSKSNFDSMISSLEAKYGSKPVKKGGRKK